VANHSPPRPPATSVELPIPSNSGAPLLGGATTPLPTGGIVVRNGLNMRLRMPSSIITTYNTGIPPTCHWWWVPAGEVNPNGYQPSMQNPAYARVSRLITSDPGASNFLREGNGWWKDSTTGNWTMMNQSCRSRTRKLASRSRNLFATEPFLFGSGMGKRTLAANANSRTVSLCLSKYGRNVTPRIRT